MGEGDAAAEAEAVTWSGRFRRPARLGGGRQQNGPGSLVGQMAFSSSVHAAGTDKLLRVGLIGCGGRGTGAASQALNADPKTELVALADVFSDQSFQDY